MRRLLLVLALALSFAFSAAQSSLEAALGFLPAGTSVAYFSDWQAVREDMRGVWPAEPEVGDDDYLRALGERHAPATALLTGDGSTAWLLDEEWGFSLLDVAWELQTDARVTVVAFSEGFSPERFLALLSQRGYETTVHEGQYVHSHPMDASLSWVRPPFTEFQNLAYLGDERALLLAFDRDALVSALDVHAGRAPAWIGGEQALGVLEGLEDADSAVLLSSGKVCFAPDDGASLQAFDLAGVGYQRAGDAVVGNIVLSYPQANAAVADLDARSALARGGSDRLTGRPLTTYFEIAGEEVLGSAVALTARLRSPGSLFDLVYLYGADFLACGA